MHRLLLVIMFFVAALCAAGPAFAGAAAPVDLTGHWAGYLAIGLFVLAYIVVVVEELIAMKKSKPVLLSAGFIWILVAIAYTQSGRDDAAVVLRHNLLEYAELALFLLAAMTYINTLTERQVFQVLRGWLTSHNFSLRALYWITGGMAFVMSPLADNLTTALVLGAVTMAVGAGRPRFVSVACINIVVAANAGGAFSPFGDITTLMVWQKGIVSFFEFFDLFLPSLVSWLIPATIMSFAVPKAQPQDTGGENIRMKKGGGMVVFLFLLTISGTVTMHQLLHLPPFLGMMMGLGLLAIQGYHLQRRESREMAGKPVELDAAGKPKKPFNIFISVKRVEWDTLLFFYGIILSVGGLGAFGYLSGLSRYLYEDLGATWANTMVGIASAIVDNIPVMFAVLSMNPDMSHGQWLLVTLTAGIGGSLLSVGSAAGVALMGVAHGAYTFFSHLKWTWAIALGYAAGVYLHIVMHGL